MNIFCVTHLAYERGHQRPPLTVYTFQPPTDGTSHISSPVTPTVEVQPQTSQGVYCNFLSVLELSNPYFESKSKIMKVKTLIL